MVEGPRPDRARAASLSILGFLVLAAAACTSSQAGHDSTQRPSDGPPAPASVRDGIDADLDFQEVRSSLFANWDPFVDPEGMPVVYEWAVGTSAGATNVQPWTGVGGATRAATTGIDLPDQQVLYVSVRATDLAGNRSATSTSNGIKIGGSKVAPTASPVAAVPSQYATVERFGITWTFAQPVLCGHFANGDWWVLGPVEVVAIDPVSRIDNGRTRHGSMINPDPRDDHQGYDSSMFGSDATRFDASRNVALDVSRSKPLHLPPGSSLVSSISLPEAGQMPQLQSCAVLTCLAEVPPEDAFRPPYCGTDKSCARSARSLDLTRLARVEAVAGAPDLRDLASRFERPWLDHQSGWSGRYLHPRDNMPDYGRDLADLVGQAALVLQLDLPETEKRPLAVQMTQLGIDLYGIVANGGRFLADGGSGGGRKFPVLLAATLLQDASMLQFVREHQFAFAEDAQTFYVEETKPGVINHGQGGYGTEDVGLAEWGNRHADDPRLDQKPWTADPYRRCCTANAWLGFVLAARIMGLRPEWGHQALFDYVDRYTQIEAKGTWTRAWSPFVERMWDRHRSSY